MNRSFIAIEYVYTCRLLFAAFSYFYLLEAKYVVTKTRNYPKRPKTIQNNPQRSQNDPQRPKTIQNDPKRPKRLHWHLKKKEKHNDSLGQRYCR